MEKKTKLVFNPALARHLIKTGFRVVDIKEHRTNKLKTVFVFDTSPEFFEELKKFTTKEND